MLSKLLTLLGVVLISIGVWFGVSHNAVPADRPAFSHAHLVITRADGKILPLDVEVAVSEPEQAYGLMFIRFLSEDRGMIFPYDPPHEVAFWMKDTFIPLDMLFVRPDHHIGRIVANARPLDTTPILSQEPVSAVIEIKGGLANKDGIAVGDKAEWSSLSSSQ